MYARIYVCTRVPYSVLAGVRFYYPSTQNPRFPQKRLFLLKNATIDNQRVTKKMQKKCKNIWSIQKFAVSLHPLSLKKQVTPKS